MLFNEYINLLFKQFIDTLVNNMKINQDELMDEFIDWLVGLEKMNNEYIGFAGSNGINLLDNHSVEVNKGIIDTLDMAGKKVSQFASTLNKPNSYLFTWGDVPSIIQENSMRSCNEYDLYHTFNPYSLRYYGDLHTLHNRGYKICYGIFGKVYDKDKNKKIDLFSNIVSSLDIEPEIDCTTIGDNYYYILYTKENVKRLILTR